MCGELSGLSDETGHPVEAASKCCKVCPRLFPHFNLGHCAVNMTKRLVRLIICHNYFALQRKLEFVHFTQEDMNILYSIKQRYIGCQFAFWSHNRTEMTAEEAPGFLDLAFRPPPGMRFIGTELVVAAYIFASAREEREVLYQDSHYDGSRKRLWSLRPGHQLFDDVLNMVVGMCTSDRDDNRKWWLPTTFSQMIVHPEQFSQPTMDYIIDRYMGVADDLMMIYVPMHIMNHWYLMIIDMWDKKLVYLDSFKSVDCNETKLRITLMKEVARYVDSLLKQDKFWEDKTSFRPSVADFDPIAPITGQQLPESQDCGVWMCQWMINSHLWLEYEMDASVPSVIPPCLHMTCVPIISPLIFDMHCYTSQEINVTTRIALAVDLVMSPHNPLAETISERAVNFWDAEMLRNHKAENRRNGIGPAHAKKGSPTI
ncbi:hypothetical protein PIB30_058821 [Stylosanthes scabra]|uniref:Ubiquitin-like protease family profile domain-containing protein n=1 Tax=Stylosanthes scabra TaxID=79078 RepID=A0ABU6SKC7_9FABA|nr:hypothetical protein [Stylosanthes scabra]